MCQSDYTPDDSSQSKREDHFISAIVCDNIRQLLADKYPNHEFQRIRGLYITENEESHTHAILGPGFRISVRDVLLTISTSKPVMNVVDLPFELMVHTDTNCVNIDLADPDSVEQLLTHVDGFLSK